MVVCAVFSGPAASGKRGIGTVKDEEQEHLLQRIRGIVKEENQLVVETFEMRFTAMEARQEQMEHRTEDLERRVGRVPGGAHTSPAEVFVTEFLEVKGFCAWDERLTKGATRADATSLLGMLMPLLPEDLRKYVQPFSLRGLRNYSIKIPVAAQVIREVKGIWSDSLKTGAIRGPVRHYPKVAGTAGRVFDHGSTFRIHQGEAD